VLERCLEKDPRKRIRDIGDVQLALDGGFESSLMTPDAAVASHKPSAWRVAAIAIASAGLAAVIAAAAAWTLKPSAPLAVTRSRFVLPGGMVFLNGARQWVDVSRDGMQIVYTANGGLFFRSLSELDARSLIADVRALTPAAVSSPVFSPDGSMVAYFEGAGTLKRMSIGGGSPATVGQCDPPWGASWSESGIIVGQGPKGIVRISEKGGALEQIVRVEATELAAHP